MNIKKYKLYLIDLDGTIYNGEKKIKFADQFVDYLNKTKTDYLFLTNNSTKEPKDVVDKLKNLGVNTTEEHVYTSSDATKMYLLKKGYNNIYIIYCNKFILRRFNIYELSGIYNFQSRVT